MRYTIRYTLYYTIYIILLIFFPNPREYVRVLNSYLDSPIYLGLVWAGLGRIRYLLQYISIISNELLDILLFIWYYISSRLILFYFILYYSRLQQYQLSNTSSSFYSSSLLTTTGMGSLLTYSGNRNSLVFALVSRFRLRILQIRSKVDSLSRYNILRLFSTRYRPRRTFLNFFYRRSVASPFTSNKTSLSSQISINRRYKIIYYIIAFQVFKVLVRPSLIISFIFFAILLLFTT